jgi:hypothetical protein
MIFQKFASEAAAWWNRYLAHVADQQQKGSFILGGAKILYPNIVLAVDAGDFFVVELIGASRSFSGLTLKKHTSPIYRYLSQFDDSEPDPLISLGEGTAGSRISRLSLAHMHDFNAVKARFPFLEAYSLSGLMRGGGRGSVIAFEEGFTWCVIEKSVLTNRSKDAFRCKNVLMMLIVSRRVKSHDLRHMFESAFPTSPAC